MSISKPQHGGVIDTNKQEKNIKCRTYYSDGYSHKKTLEEAITDLILGIEDCNIEQKSKTR